jgi:hypothetical protein
MYTHKGYEHLESERDDVNGLPELWDIDPSRRLLVGVETLRLPPAAPPGVRRRATRGGHQPAAFWRDAAGRQRSESFDTAAEADATKRSRGSKEARYRRADDDV